MTTAAPTTPTIATATRRARARLATVILAHPIVDVYSGFVPPLLGVLQVRCDLTATQTALLLSIGPLTSGLCQPIFAWMSDRTDTRLAGPAGLALAAACLSSIGLASSFASLVVLFAVGMLGVGAFHPVAAASVGRLAGARRAVGVTLFFVAGMLGATLGPILSTRITAIEPGGFDLLRWLMVPGLVTAVVLHLAIGNVTHRDDGHRALRFEPRDIRGRWWGVAVLAAGNALRFSVNIALVYVFVRWAELVVMRDQPALTAELVARRGAIFCGELNALMMLGMGLGGLGVGLTIRAGRERPVYVLVPLLLAPAVALFPLTGPAVNHGLAVLAGVAYGAVIPVSISTAQHLLPHRTSLASSLMMGGPWALSAAAPPLAQASIDLLGVQRTFAVIAVALALSGVFGLLLPANVARAAGPPRG